MKPIEVVEAIWHFKVDDNMDWFFCAGILQQDGYEISVDEVEDKFLTYFRDLTGVEPYTKCPKCGELVLPRRSQYGYFVGCSSFPSCKFVASKTKPYKV